MSMYAGFQILAAQGREQMIVYYPNFRVVRLIWKRTTLRFAADEFSNLVAVFEQTLRGGLDVADGIARMRQHDDGYFELDVDGTMLRLLPADYWLLGSLLETAWHRLTHGDSVPVVAPPPRPDIHLN